MSVSNIVELFFVILGGVSAVYGTYFAITAVFSLKRRKRYVETEPETRFAAVIAARNEAAVIGQLIQSLQQQNYPPELIDIYVAPNNCTDNTREIALGYGANIFDPTGSIHSKGEVLTQIVDVLLEKDNYNAICVFDADNLVHPDFLRRMNDAKLSGAEIAQGLRDSKNPTDSAISTCYSICYWTVNRFYNEAREALGLSSLINGTGFMVTMPLLKRLGGWHTQTLTEDMEFSALCVMAGSRIRYVPDAIIYDEQPLTFLQSWRQRRRWSTGTGQGMKLFLLPLLKRGVKEKKMSSIDLAFIFMSPALAVLSVVSNIYMFLHQPISFIQTALLAFPAGALAAAFIIWFVNGRLPAGTWKGVVFFPIFLLTWVPIKIISLVKEQKTWDIIPHTRSLHIHDFPLQTVAHD